MTLKNYFVLSTGIFVLAVLALRHLPLPMFPFVLILLVGETLLGFQVENHRVGRLLSALFSGPKRNAPNADTRRV